MFFHCNEEPEKILLKKVFIEISDSNLTFLKVFDEVSLNLGVFYVPITHATMTMESSDSP